MRVSFFALFGVLTIGCSLSPNIDLPSKGPSGGDGTAGMGDGDDGGINIPPDAEQPGSGPGGAPCTSAVGGAGGAPLDEGENAKPMTPLCGGAK